MSAVNKRISFRATSLLAPKALVAALLLGGLGGAQAICVSTNIFLSSSQSWGAETTDGGSCIQTRDGGEGSSSADIPLTTSTAGSALANASLATGVIAAAVTSNSGWSATEASAAVWDTITFSGLAAGGSTVTEMLTLSGALSGSQAGGSATVYGSGGSTNSSFGYGTALPGSVSYSFTAYNNVAYFIGAVLDVSAANGSSADLADPPTFSILTPTGTGYTTASGDFTNVFSAAAAVPEPGGLALTALGLALLAGSRRRARRPT